MSNETEHLSFEQPAGVRIELPDLDLAALDRLAMQLLPILRRGDFVSLIGDLGSGKTTFARSLILRLLGPGSTEEVPSPSFAIVQTYDTARMTVHHFDFYRLSSADETRELGLEDALSDGLVLAEWPERLEEDVPSDRLEIYFSEAEDPERRTLILRGVGAFVLRLQRLIDINRFLNNVGWDTAWRQFLQGDASPRAYTRLIKTSEKALLMDAPKQPDGPPIRNGKPYSAISHLAEDVRPFVAIANALRELGCSAPEIYAHDLDKGLLLIEDFGDEVYGAQLRRGAQMAPLYSDAAHLLAHLATTAPPAELSLPDGSAYQLPRYDFEAYSIELELLLDWFWPSVKGENPSEQLRAEYLDLWEAALQPVIAASDNWALRDVHSPNLIWLPERDGVKRVGLIDFQDAQRGHAAYDLVSLLQDARETVPVEIEHECLDSYLAARMAADADFDETAFLSAYAILGAQRNTKILGIFIRLAKRDNKPIYLQHIPRVAAYLKRNLDHPGLSAIKAWYDEHIPAKDREDPVLL